MKLTSQKQRRGRTAELEMTSMIDVVFLLLIFFMVTTATLKHEKNIPTGVTEKSQGARKTEVQLDPIVVEVIADPAGDTVYLMGNATYKTKAALASRLQSLASLSSSQKVKKILKVSDLANFGAAVAARQAFADAGLSPVKWESK